MRGVQEETVSAQSSSTTLPDESCQCREYLAWHSHFLDDSTIFAGVYLETHNLFVDVSEAYIEHE